MATEVGNLKLELEYDSVLRAEAALDNLEQSAKSTEKQVDNLGKTSKKTAPGVKSTGDAANNTADEFGDLEGAARAAAGAVGDVGDAAQDASNPLRDLPDAANDSGDRLGMMGRRAGMAGIQVEQLAGQIAAGQNPIRAFGVQAADLGFILGVPLLGAVVGIGAAFASVLLPNLFDSKDAAEELEEAFDDVQGAFERSTAGAFGLSQELKDLAKSSRDLARLELSLAVLNAEHAFKQASDNISNSLAEIDRGLIGSADKYMAYAMAAEETRDAQAGANAHFVATANRVATISEEFGISKQAAALLAAQLMEFRQHPSIEGLAGVARTAAQTAESEENANAAFRAFLTTLTEQVRIAQDAGEALEFLNDVLEENEDVFSTATTHADGYAQTIDGMVAALEMQRDRIGLSARQLAIQAAEARGATDDQIRLIESIYNEIDARLANEKAVNDEAEAKKRAALEEANRKKRETENAARTYEQIIRLNQTKIQALQEQETQWLASLEGQLKRGEIAQAEYQRAVLEISAYGAQQRAEIEQNALRESDNFWHNWLERKRETMLTFDDIQATAINSFEQGVVNAFDAMIFKSEDAEDAIKNFAKGMARAVIGALVQMAAQQAAYFLAEKMFGKGAAAGAAAANSAFAASQVAMAALNAYSSTAAIPVVGPALAPAAAALAAAQTAPMAGAVAALGGTAVAARALGGQVRGGESYLVGERGPEILRMGSMGGSITPNSSIRNDNSQVVNKTANVSFNIQANDTQGFDELLIQRRGVIISVINEALNDQGRASLA